jgi:hypothetical protein
VQTRITRFKMRPDAVDAARALVDRLRAEIMAQPGMQRCIIVMNPDGSGHVIALIDARGTAPESIDHVRALWHKFHGLLETMPEPEIFDVVADWSIGPS